MYLFFFLCQCLNRHIYIFKYILVHLERHFHVHTHSTHLHAWYTKSTHMCLHLSLCWFICPVCAALPNTLLNGAAMRLWWQPYAHVLWTSSVVRNIWLLSSASLMSRLKCRLTCRLRCASVFACVNETLSTRLLESGFL